MTQTKTKKKRELASTNIRIYKSTHLAIKAEAEKNGKSIARILDEWYCSEKY